jgi:hypothetical protein
VVKVLSVKQSLERGQESDNENYKHQQQKKLLAEDRSSVLQEFPHLKVRYDKTIAECMLNMNNNIKSVNEFFELSNDMLNNNYLDNPHTVNESPCQDIILSRKLENSSLTEYACDVCLLKFYILGQVEEHCKLVKPDKHKQAILSIIYRSWLESLAEINQRYDSDISEFATVIAKRRTT